MTDENIHPISVSVDALSGESSKMWPGPLKHIIITVILNLPLWAAVWFHAVLNRYEVVAASSKSDSEGMRYDRITGMVWVIFEKAMYESHVKR